jgi:precorrin-3B methylase
VASRAGQNVAPVSNGPGGDETKSLQRTSILNVGDQFVHAAVHIIFIIQRPSTNGLHNTPMTQHFQRCQREYLSGLQKRNIRSANILVVFQQYCYVPKHTVGEQLLHVREAKRERAAYDSASVTEDVFSPS